MRKRRTATAQRSKTRASNQPELGGSERRLEILDSVPLVAAACWLATQPKDLFGRPSQPFLWRVMNGEKPNGAKIEQRVLLGMRVACSRSGRKDLDEALGRVTMSEEAEWVIEGTYSEWLRERVARRLHRKGSRVAENNREMWVVAPEDVAGKSYDKDILLGPLRGIAVLRWKEACEALKLVEESCAPIVDGFRQQAERRGHGLLRTDLSLHRAIEPLLESAESGFVERGLDELSPKDLQRYMRHALRAELILLDRTDDDTRYQQIAANGQQRYHSRQHKKKGRR